MSEGVWLYSVSEQLPEGWYAIKRYGDEKPTFTADGAGRASLICDFLNAIEKLNVDNIMIVPKGVEFAYAADRLPESRP